MLTIIFRFKSTYMYGFDTMKLHDDILTNDMTGTKVTSEDQIMHITVNLETSLYVFESVLCRVQES